MKISDINDGKVYLLATPTRTFADVAAKFVRLEKPIAEIVDAPRNDELIQRLLDSGHLSALEFDSYIFGVESYSRVTETQLVRKRHASYLIKSGRAKLGERREYSLVMPTSVSEFPGVREFLEQGEALYNELIRAGVPDEDARYLKPQATEFKALISMNTHALLDFFRVRCCLNAQREIRDLAWKMLHAVKKHEPQIFKDAGPSCKVLGYCPEDKLQNQLCKASGRRLPKSEALKLLNEVAQEKVLF